MFYSPLPPSPVSFPPFPLFQASGVQPFAFPSNTGLRVGLGADFVGLHMNTHYDNPAGLKDQVDNSGIRIFYVEAENFREHDVGIMQVGDPQVMLADGDSAIPDGRSKVTMGCPGSCTQHYLAGSGSGTGAVTLISAQLHMHGTGDAIRVEQKRSGEVVNTFKTEFYDYAFQVSWWRGEEGRGDGIVYSLRNELVYSPYVLRRCSYHNRSLLLLFFPVFFQLAHTFLNLFLFPFFFLRTLSPFLLFLSQFIVIASFARRL